MHDTTLLVKIPDTLSDLHDDVSGKLFREVGEFDDLVEKLSSAHQPAREGGSASDSSTAREKTGTHSRVR
jgi:hypothetical protein